MSEPVWSLMILRRGSFRWLVKIWIGWGRFILLVTRLVGLVTNLGKEKRKGYRIRSLV